MEEEIIHGGRFERYVQHSFFKPIRQKALLKILKTLPKGSILDIGCMDDYLLKKLPKDFDYLGIDENPLCTNEKIKKGFVEDYVSEKKFDIVICSEVLEHVKNPIELIEKLKQYSNKYLIISVPNEPFFALFRGLIPAKEHLWTIFPKLLKLHFGEPILEKTICFKRSYVGVWKDPFN